MEYQTPVLQLKHRHLTPDEWWWVAGVLVFALRVFSSYQLEQAVESCERSGGIRDNRE